MTQTTYTDQQRVVFAQKVLNPPDFDTETLKALVQYWGVFVPFPPRPMTQEEGWIRFVESLYDQMRPYAFEWLTDYRLRKLERAVEGPISIIPA